MNLPNETDTTTQPKKKSRLGKVIFEYNGFESEFPSDNDFVVKFVTNMEPIDNTEFFDTKSEDEEDKTSLSNFFAYGILILVVLLTLHAAVYN